MSFRKFIAESQLLLEYDADTTWKQHGAKVKTRANHMYHDLGDTHSVLGAANHTEDGVYPGMQKKFRYHNTPEEEEVAMRQHVLPHLEATDPTANKKYVQHVARIFGAGGVNRFEDLHMRMKPTLEKFDDLAKRKVLPAEHRDIGKVKSLTQLEDLVDAHKDQLSGKETNKAYHDKMKGQATINDHEELTHIIPHTAAAASHFGKGTRWCTTSGYDGEEDEHADHEDSMFSHYNNDGPLHILIPKTPRYAGEKYQYHYASQQFMNEKDEPADHYGDPPGGQAHSAVHQWRKDYDAKMEEVAKTPEALNHPEKAVGNKFLEKHANEEQMHEVLKSGTPTQFASMSSNPNFPRDTAVKTVLDHNIDKKMRKYAMKSHYETADDLTRVLNDKNEHPDVVKAGVAGLHSASEHVYMALNHDNPEIAAAALRHSPSTSEEHLLAAADHPDENVRQVAAGHAGAAENVLAKLAHDPHPDVAWAVQANKNATDKVKEMALTYPHKIDQDSNPYHSHPLQAALDNDYMHSDAEAFKLKVLDHPDSNMRYSAIMGKASSPMVLYKALDDPDPSVRSAAASNSGATGGVIDKALEKGLHGTVANRYDDKLEPHHIDKIVDDSPEHWHRLLRSGGDHPNKYNIDKLQPHHIDKMLDQGVHGSWLRGKVMDPMWPGAPERDRHTYTHLAIRSPNASSANLDKAIEHSEPQVRRMAAIHPNLAPHHVEKLTHDSDRHVLTSVLKNEHVSDEALGRLTHHPDGAVRYAALHHPNIKEHHLLASVGRPDLTAGDARNSVLHDSATPAVYLKLANHSNPDVARYGHTMLHDENGKRTLGRLEFKEGRSFKNFINESILLLEYDAEKTWSQHGTKAANRAAQMDTAGDDHKVYYDAFRSSKATEAKSAGTHDEHVRSVLQKHFEKSDPTPQKKYVQHITRIYGNGGVGRFEDLHNRMKPALESFHDLVNRKVMPAEHRDIGRVKSLNQLEDLVSAHGDQKSAKQEKAGEHEKMKGQATITDHPEFTHIVPHTAAAGNHFGKGTRWCTTGTHGAGMFNHYTKNGPLQIMIPKNPSRPGEKYQYHFSSGQFMDETDRPAHNHDGERNHTLGMNLIGNPKSHTNLAIHNHVTEYQTNAEKAAFSPDGVSHPETKVAESALKNANVGPKELHDAMKGGAALQALDNPHINKEHIKAALLHDSTDVRQKALTKHADKVDPADLHHALHQDAGTALAALKHHSIGSDHVRVAMDHNDAGVKIAALAHPMAPSDLIDDAMSHPKPATRALVARSAGGNAVDKALDDRHHLVRWAGVYNKNAKPEHFEKAFKDEHQEVRVAAVSHRNAPQSVLDKGVKDKDPVVRAAARGHFNSKVKDTASINKDMKYPPLIKSTSLRANRGDSFAFVHVPGNETSEARLKAVKIFTKNHNRTSDQKMRTRIIGRAGKGNPWSKTREGQIAQRHGNTARGHESRADVYVSSAGQHGHGREHPIFESTKSFEALCGRAEEIGIELSVLTEVFNRGLNEWNDDSNKNAEQYAFNRVNSFISGGMARKLDEDLLTEVSATTLNNYIRKAKIVVDHTPEDSRVHKKSKKGIQRAERKLVPEEQQLDELSPAVTQKYVKKAEDSVKELQSGEYDSDRDNKAFKRKMYISFAKHAKLKESVLEEDKIRHPDHKQAYVEPYEQDGKPAYKASNRHGKVKFFNELGKNSAFKHAGLNEDNYVLDNSGTELIERELLDPVKLVTVHRRDTKNIGVIKRYNEKRRAMHDHHRTENALARKFVKRGKDNHLIDKQNRHQLTDRFRLQRLERIKMMRKTKLKESTDYIEARQKLHDAHAEASRQHAGMERDPELRRLDLHRAKKHSVASRVLEILKTKTKKKK